MQFISLNQFLDKEFRFCFVCGLDDYDEFHFNGHLYRVCRTCMLKDDVSRFFHINILE